MHLGTTTARSTQRKPGKKKKEAGTGAGAEEDGGDGVEAEGDAKEEGNEDEEEEGKGTGEGEAAAKGEEEAAAADAAGEDGKLEGDPLGADIAAPPTTTTPEEDQAVTNVSSKHVHVTGISLSGAAAVSAALAASSRPCCAWLLFEASQRNEGGGEQFRKQCQISFPIQLEHQFESIIRFPQKKAERDGSGGQSPEIIALPVHIDASLPDFIIPSELYDASYVNGGQRRWKASDEL